MYDIAERRRRREQRHKELEQCGLQLSHTGSYLDVEESINDQKEDFEGYDKQKKHSVILRTKLSVRVAGILEKLRTSSGRDLRRALFSLKQLFQDDQDLVHEFISAGGLDCLIQLGMECDQNHRSYILRALGEIMLFMDGMNGIIEHNQAIQWLYSLLTMQYRLVVKSALKLLIVFVEYAETNAQLFVKALKQEDSSHGREIGSHIMSILKDPEQDSEITTYVMTLVNKTLSYIPDQDTFYDLTDAFEKQGIEDVSQRVCSKRSSDLDLVEQFKLYEYALKQEDGEIDIPDKQKMSLRKARRSLDVTNQQRKSLRAGGLKPTAEYSDFQKRLSLDSVTPSLQVENGEDAISSQRRRREQRRSRGSFAPGEDSEDPIRPSVDDASSRLQRPPASDTFENRPAIYQRSGSEEVSGITHKESEEQASAQVRSREDKHHEGFEKSKEIEGTCEVDERDFDGYEVREDVTTDDNSYAGGSYSMLGEHTEEVHKEHSTEKASGFQEEITSGDDPRGSEVQNVVTSEDGLSLNSRSVEDSSQRGSPLLTESDRRTEMEQLTIPSQEDEDESSKNDVSMESEMLQESEEQKQLEGQVGQVSLYDERVKATDGHDDEDEDEEEDEEMLEGGSKKNGLEKAENMETPVLGDSASSDDAAVSGNQEVMEEEDDDVFTEGTSVQKYSKEGLSGMLGEDADSRETESEGTLSELKGSVSGTIDKGASSNITFPETSSVVMPPQDPFLVSDGRAGNSESPDDFSSGDGTITQRKRLEYQTEVKTHPTPRKSLSPGIDDLQSEGDCDTKSDDIEAVSQQRYERKRLQKEAAMQVTDGEMGAESSSLQTERTSSSKRHPKHRHESWDQEVEEGVDVKEGVQHGRRRRRRREESYEEVTSGTDLVDQTQGETQCEGEVGIQEKSRTRHRRRRRLKSAEDGEGSKEDHVAVIERVDEKNLADASVLGRETNQRMLEKEPRKTQDRGEENEVIDLQVGKFDVEYNSFQRKQGSYLVQEKGSSKNIEEQLSVPFGDRSRSMISEGERRDYNSGKLHKEEEKEVETELKQRKTLEGDGNEKETERERWRRERREKYRQKRAQRKRESSESDQIRDDNFREKEENDVFISVPSEREKSAPRRSTQSHIETLSPNEWQSSPQVGVLGDASLQMEINDEDDLMRMLRGDSCTKAEIVPGTDDVMPRRRLYSRRRRREGSGSFEDLQSVKSTDVQKSVSEDSFDTTTVSTDSDPVNKRKDDKREREDRRVEDLQEPQKRPERTKEEDEILNLLRGGIEPVEVAYEPESASSRRMRQRRWRRSNRVESDERDDSIEVEDAVKTQSSLNQDVKGRNELLLTEREEVTARYPKETAISEKMEMVEKVTRDENEEEVLPNTGMLVDGNKEPAAEDEQSLLHARIEESHQSYKDSDEQPYLDVNKTACTQRMEEQSTSSGRKRQKQRSEDKRDQKLSVSQTDEGDILSILRGGDTDSRKIDIKEISDSKHELEQSDKGIEERVQLKKEPVDRRTSPLRKSASSEKMEEEQTVFRVSLRNRRPKDKVVKKTSVEPKEEEDLVSLLRGGAAASEKNQISDEVSTSEPSELLREGSRMKEETDTVEVKIKKSGPKQEKDRRVKPLKVKASIVTSEEKPEEKVEKEKIKSASKTEPKEDVKVVRLKLRSKTAKVTTDPPRKKPDAEEEEDLMSMLRGGLPTSDREDSVPAKTIKLRSRTHEDSKPKLEEESSRKGAEQRLSQSRGTSRETDEERREEPPLLTGGRKRDGEQKKSRVDKVEVILGKHEKSVGDEIMPAEKDEVAYTVRRRKGMTEDTRRRKVIVTPVEVEGEEDLLSGLKGGDVKVSASSNFEKSSKKVPSKQVKDKNKETEKTHPKRNSDESDILNILKGGDVSISGPDTTELKISAKPILGKQNKENLSTIERPKSSSKSKDQDVLSKLKGGDVSGDGGDNFQTLGKVRLKKMEERGSIDEKKTVERKSREDDLLSILKGGDGGVSTSGPGERDKTPAKAKQIEEKHSPYEKIGEKKPRENDVLSVLKDGDVGSSALGTGDRGKMSAKAKQIEEKRAPYEKTGEKKPRENDLLSILKGGDVDNSALGSGDKGKTPGKVRQVEDKRTIYEKGVEKKPRENDLLSKLKGGDVGVSGSAGDDKRRTPKVLHQEEQEDDSTHKRNFQDGRRKHEESKLSHSKVGDRKESWRKDDAKDVSLRHQVVDQKSKKESDLLDILRGGDIGLIPPGMPGSERIGKYGSKPQTDRDEERKGLGKKGSLVDERRKEREEKQQADSRVMRKRDEDRVASKFEEEPPVADSLRKDERQVQKRRDFEQKTEKDRKWEKNNLDTAGTGESILVKDQKANKGEEKYASLRKRGLQTVGDKERNTDEVKKEVALREKRSEKFESRQLSEETDGTLLLKGKDSLSRKSKLADGDESKSSQVPKDQSSKISSRIESLSKANENQKMKKKDPYIPFIKQADIKEKILSKSSEEGHPPLKKENVTPLVKQSDLKEKYLTRGQDQKQPQKKEHFVPSSKQSDIKEKLLSKTVEEPKHHPTPVSKPAENIDVRDKHLGTKQNAPKDVEAKSGLEVSPAEERKTSGPRGKFLPSPQEGGSLPRNFKAGESQRQTESSQEFGGAKGKEKVGKSSRKKDTSKSLEELLDIAVAMKSMPRRRKQKQIESNVDGSKDVTEAVGQKEDQHGREKMDRKQAQVHPGKEEVTVSPGDTQQKKGERLPAAGKREVFGKDRTKGKVQDTVEQGYGYPKKKTTALEKDVEIEKQKRVRDVDMRKRVTDDKMAADVHKSDQGELRRRKREEKGEVVESRQNRNVEGEGSLPRRSKTGKSRSVEKTSKEMEGIVRDEEVIPDKHQQGHAVEDSTDDRKREGGEEASEKKKHLLDRWLKQKPKDKKQVSDDVIAPRKKNLHEKFQSQRNKWLEGSKEGTSPKKDKTVGKKPSKLNSRYQTMVKEADLVDEHTKQDGDLLRRGMRKEESEIKGDKMIEGEEKGRPRDRKYDASLSSPLRAYEDESEGEEEDYSEDEDTYDGEFVDEVDIPDLTLSYSDGYSDEESSTQFFSFPSDEEVSGHSERTKDSASAKVQPLTKTPPRYSSSPLRQMNRPSEESSETLCLTDSEEDQSLVTLKESEMSLEQQLRREVGDDDSVFLAGSFESLDMRSGSELSSLGERSDGLEVRSLLGQEEDLENRLTKTKSLPSNLDNCHRRGSYPGEEVFSSFTPPSRRRGIKQSEESLVSQAESAESLMSGGTGTSIESGVSAESGIEIDEKIREGLQELKEELLDEDELEESMEESEDEDDERKEEAVVQAYPDESRKDKKTSSRKARRKRSSLSRKMRVPEVVIQEPQTPTENGYSVNHRRKDELPPVEDTNVSGTNASECSETVNECIPNATSHSQPDPLTQPEEENGSKKLHHIPEEPRLSFIPPNIEPSVVNSSDSTSNVSIKGEISFLHFIIIGYFLLHCQ
ncbi:FH1/FH2 domain-containing protein 3 [Holothuria leucospilota]|uniref:FH1/FH2 domain-containing protein 3 n=1 Tax=Holothuria leucospilota TaxID=206669 RepID=A0A9Q1C8V7_HOLLE|nr:FH1/FH2 domain-containing protein 3 [Holothuria leucospilota]